MRRIIAVVLAGSMALQASGCTTTFPAQPTMMVAQNAPGSVRATTVSVAAPSQNPNQVVAAPVSIQPPDIPTSDFLGGPAAGILAGVVLIGVIGLAIVFAGGKGSSGGAGGGGGGGPTVPTVPTRPTAP